MPSFTIIPSAPGRPLTGHVWVPIDDYNCWTYTISWHPERPLKEEELAEYHRGDQIHAAVDADYRTLANRDNEYNLDRTMQRKENYSGIVGVGVQDMSVQESMGVIVDRSKEMLGVSDTAIAHWRRLMLTQAKTNGGAPLGTDRPESYRVRTGAVLLNKDVDVFKTFARELMPA